MSLLRRCTLLALAVGSLNAGCAAANPLRLEDQILTFHDDLRWGRMPAAEMIVSAQMRPSFTRRHAGWGRAIQIMDVELQGTRISGLSGTATARYLWMRSADLTTRETEIETRWHGTFDGNWVCEDEHVVGGDPTLLSTLNAPGTAAPTPR